jgi:hypothetical protein
MRLIVVFAHEFHRSHPNGLLQELQNPISAKPEQPLRTADESQNDEDANAVEVEFEIRLFQLPFTIQVLINDSLTERQTHLPFVITNNMFTIHTAFAQFIVCDEAVSVEKEEAEGAHQDMLLDIPPEDKPLDIRPPGEVGVDIQSGVDTLLDKVALVHGLPEAASGGMAEVSEDTPEAVAGKGKAVGKPDMDIQAALAVAAAALTALVAAALADAALVALAVADALAALVAVALADAAV